MSSHHRKLPPVGSLVTLHPYAQSMDFVKVEALVSDETSAEECITRNFPIGTVAMVVEHIGHPDEPGGMQVPVVLVENFKGWIFNDEWKRMPARRRKNAT
jgi:hypothetical protein